MAPAMGYTVQLGMGSASPVTELYEFISDNLVCEQTIEDLSAIRGTRSHPVERTRETKRDVRGPITMQPNPVELSRLLPRILGAAASGTTFALAETLPEFFVTSDRTTKVLTYNGVKVNKGTFRAATGAALQLILDLIGKDETPGNAGTFPALTFDETAQPFVLSDLALTIGGTVFQCDQWECAVDNALEVRFGNSIIATAITATDRTVTLNTRVPWGDAATLYGSGSGGAGVPVTANFVSPALAVSCLFTFPALVFPKSSPVVDARGELWLPIKGVAKKTGGTSELTVTLDSTP